MRKGTVVAGAGGNLLVPTHARAPVKTLILPVPGLATPKARNVTA